MVMVTAIDLRLPRYSFGHNPPCLARSLAGFAQECHRRIESPAREDGAEPSLASYAVGELLPIASECTKTHKLLPAILGHDHDGTAALDRLGRRVR